MSDVSPTRTVTIGDVSYTLDGSFSIIRSVQEAFKRDAYQLRADILDMRADQLALLIALGTGVKGAQDSIGQHITDSIDICDPEIYSPYITLKIELFAWWNTIIAPKVDREKKSAEMQTLLDVRKKKLSSLGTTTSDSPSAPLDGNPVSSGEATSGS